MNTTTEPEIVRVDRSDVKRLQSIARQTFYETFSEGNSEENMQNYLATKFSDEHLSAELNDDRSQFYFAILGSRVIGYLKINFGAAQTELKDDRGLEIERIYVLMEFHGKKVGQLLLDRVLSIAKNLELDYLWLGVWEENPRAVNFYKKNGFVEFGKHVFRLGDDDQTDILMKLRLT